MPALSEIFDRVLPRLPSGKRSPYRQRRVSFVLPISRRRERPSYLLFICRGAPCLDLVKIALTVPSGNPVLFAIFRAPIPADWFSLRTVRTVFSGRGGLPSLLPLDRATLSPAIVRSDILALSCLASVANIEIITSLNGPVESSHCS